MPQPSHAPFHAHIYYAADTRSRAATLRDQLLSLPTETIAFVGALRDHKVGPHPCPQFEIHFHAYALGELRPILEAAGLTILIHPLTDDDLADHTRLAHWIGAPLDLDISTLDPPGVNQGASRFGRTDF